jgi:hypothetical protein
MKLALVELSRIIAGRNVLNVCGELNTIVNHDYQYVGGLNQNIFGAAYYASVLIHLLRGGADLEMRLGCYLQMMMRME